MSGDDSIKTVFSFRQKDLDKYLRNTQHLLKKQHQLKGELSFLKKNLKAIENELRKENKWLMKENLG